jgi:hypothetical protein
VSNDYFEKCVKLSNVAGRKVVDVVGHISTEFGDPVFHISAIQFEDGSHEWCDGEHDFPYIALAIPDQFLPKDDADE